MTPHGPPRQNLEVGVRELRDGLSRYVDDARRGDTTVITVRGRPVARLVPVEGHDPFEDLRARGVLTEPTRPPTRRSSRRRIKSKGPASDLVKEQRR